jgi:hypothetical protein
LIYFILSSMFALKENRYSLKNLYSTFLNDERPRILTKRPTHVP